MLIPSNIVPAFSTGNRSVEFSLSRPISSEVNHSEDGFSRATSQPSKDVASTFSFRIKQFTGLIAMDAEEAAMALREVESTLQFASAHKPTYLRLKETLASSPIKQLSDKINELLAQVKDKQEFGHLLRMISNFSVDTKAPALASPVQPEHDPSLIDWCNFEQVNAFVNRLTKDFSNEPSMAHILFSLSRSTSALGKNPFDTLAAWTALLESARNYNDQVGSQGLFAKALLNVCQVKREESRSRLNAWVRARPKVSGGPGERDPFLRGSFLTPMFAEVNASQIEYRASAKEDKASTIRFLDEYSEVILDEKSKEVRKTITGDQVVANVRFNHFSPCIKQIFPINPKVDDIKQGRIGDCYLLACLSALARRSPHLIEEMIQDYGDFAMVRFFSRGTDGSQLETWVQVNKSLIMDTSDLTVQAKGNALWPAIIEKAYMMFKGESIDNIFGGRGPAKDQFYELTGRGHIRTVISSTSESDVKSNYKWLIPPTEPQTETQILRRKKVLRNFSAGLTKEGKAHAKRGSFDSLNTADRAILDARLRLLEIRRLQSDPILGKLNEHALERIVELEKASTTFRKELATFQTSAGKNDYALILVAEAAGIKMGILHQHVRDYHENGPRRLYKQIKKNLCENGFGTIGTCEAPELKACGLAGNHAYEIVDTIENGKNLMVRFRNPWGRGGVKYVGGQLTPDKEQAEFDLKIEDIQTFFRTMAFGRLQD